MCRACAGRSMPRAESNNTRSPIAILPLAGRPEECGDPAGKLFVELQQELALPKREVKVDHGRRPDRAVIQFDSASAAKAIAAETSTSCAACVSRPVSANE